MRQDVRGYVLNTVSGFAGTRAARECAMQASARREIALLNTIASPAVAPKTPGFQS